MFKFKKDFWWGAASSGCQTESDKDKPNLNIMDYWYKQTPTDFYDNKGPNITCDTYSNYKTDVKLMSEIGLNSFRTSIQWTRLIKNLYTGEVDLKQVEFYRNYFLEIKKNNIKLIVNLFHFDTPIELENIGGWTNKKTVELYFLYAKQCFKYFSDLVDYWTTFNEPIVLVDGCYLNKWYYPKISNLKLAIQAAYNTILAHCKVANYFHSYFKNDQNKKISIILNLTPTIPKNSELKHLKAAKIRDELLNKSFLNAVIKGQFSNFLIKFLNENNLMPEYDQSELNEIKKTRIDFLAVNYYQPARVQAPNNNLNNSNDLKLENWFEVYVDKKSRINPYRGWEIHPQTLYDIAIDIKNNYDNIPWIVSENGIGVGDENRFLNKQGYIDDQYRIDFIKEHLIYLYKAIEQGSNCFGYHMWTLIDNWSWANGFKNRYGFISLDTKTLKRTIKKSGYWIKQVIKDQGFE
ncbi:beta-glucosidase [synthetic Mycoplasma mycoides JCVI-syn1.0]|uniref:Glycoside hydrolase family 1 protein n=1 Tax=Mycoplasma mycoides subsp. capri TaxID=40477 RepID=A0AB38GEZ1_MYCMC|nr:glycoside hydrolase family 1 protein [Mycoplasma mycoides]ADH21945.1 beta-glucosidase [synthetic Mycoplasma mycoides JCVI-syn1.0]ACU78326.1 beta-glucosidase [Mycoplasma mycoides subsp. capri str. GM12]ACU79156.1 beta-glucosidase [Mycoplasma mycoides subsp. capri str. GM12]SRX61904.1 glycoside hydrolase family 1 protein [Mycoplasma mycoides subsp. capri]SRX62350.1 glycoside hydrolase family 1 protein [Mycoplasma mycoides subsp. capri]